MWHNNWTKCHWAKEKEAKNAVVVVGFKATFQKLLPISPTETISLFSGATHAIWQFRSLTPHCSKSQFYVQKISFRKRTYKIVKIFWTQFDDIFWIKNANQMKEFRIFTLKLVKIGFFKCFVCSFWGQNQVFWHKINYLILFKGDNFKIILQFWLKNSNMSKGKVLSKLRFWTQIRLL